MFDYESSAELYSGHVGMKLRRKIGYQRFARAADAVQFAIEQLPPAQLMNAFLEADDQRFGASGIRGLYDDDGYPLQRRITAQVN